MMMTVRVLSFAAVLLTCICCERASVPNANGAPTAVVVEAPALAPDVTPKVEVVAAPAPALDVTPSAEVVAAPSQAPAPDATVLFVQDKEGALVPVVCAIDGIFEADPAKCLAPVQIGDEVIAALPRPEPRSERGQVLAKVTATTCRPPVPALQVSASSPLGLYQLWPVARVDALRRLADAEPTDDERDAVLALLPAEARRIAVENRPRHDPLGVGVVDLDGDRVAETIYVVNVAATFDPKEEGMPDEYVFHGLVVRLGGSSRLELALTSEEMISVNRVTDLDRDGRAELLLWGPGTHQLARVGGGALRRIGAPRCAF